MKKNTVPPTKKEKRPVKAAVSKCPPPSAVTYDQAVDGVHSSEKYLLRLYVAGINPRSAEAIRSITALCDEHLKDLFELEIIDLYQQPARAKDDQIIAIPTLIRKLPMPLRRLIGNMSNKDKLLLGLDLPPKKS